MSDQPAAPTGEVPEFPTRTSPGSCRSCCMMFRALIGSPVRNALFMLGGLLFTVIAATAYGQIRLNSWNQPFYDALSHRDLAGSCSSWASSA